MLSYIIRRILLMIPTFFGITLLVFTITQLAPGGPIEQMIAEMRHGDGAGGGRAVGSGAGGQSLDTEAIESLKKFYGFDKPIPIRYLIWIGFYPRDADQRTLKKADIFKPQRVTLKTIEFQKTTYSLQKWVKIVDENGKYVFYESGMGADFKFANYPELPNANKIKNWYPSKGWQYENEKNGGIRFFRKEFAGVVQGNLGVSYTYSRPVIDIIVSKIPVSLYFGLIALILSYAVSIPLGIRKAVLNNSQFDVITSIIIFTLYAIPAFVLALVMLSFFASPSFFEIFPLGGFKSAKWDTFPLHMKIIDIMWHTALPVFVWNIGEFAVGTVMMKNSFLENASQDYTKTGFAKGLTEKQVMYGHVLRNSLIPILTGIGSILTVVFTGSMLLERVFNIPGAGLLSYTSIVQRDYPISLGYLVLGSILGLTGRLVSDISYAIADPRIRFS